MRKLKYKLFAASAASREDANGDFEKIRVSIETARRAFDAHESTHAPMVDPLPVERSEPAPDPQPGPPSKQQSKPTAQQETRSGRPAILMPAISL